MHTKTKGLIAELKFAAHLVADGWNVFLPLGENCRYDLVAEKKNKFIRLQVKYVTPKNGGLDINCSSSNNWSVLPYQINEIDYIVAFDSHSNDIYFLPIEEITKYKFKLRLVGSKNNQNRGIHMAEKYRNIKI